MANNAQSNPPLARVTNRGLCIFIGALSVAAVKKIYDAFVVELATQMSRGHAQDKTRCRILRLEIKNLRQHLNLPT